MFESDNERFQFDRFAKACWGEEWTTLKLMCLFLSLAFCLLVLGLFISQ
jgi:hypothetical protein